MTPLPADIEQTLRDAYRATGRYFRNGALFVSVVGAIAALGGAARGIWWLAGFSAVFFGVLVALGIKLARRYDDPAKSPVMRALFEAPDRIAILEKFLTDGGAAYLRVKLATKEFLALRVDPAHIDHVRGVLADRSPNAEIKPPIDIPAARVVRS